MSELRKTPEEKKLGALKSKDALEYFVACNELGVDAESAENSKLYLEGRKLYEQGIRGMEDAERTKRDTTTSFDFVRYKAAVEEGSYDVNTIFVQRDEKEQLLRECGLEYVVLRRGGPVPLRDVRDSRIGELFHQYFEEAVRRAKQLEPED